MVSRTENDDTPFFDFMALVDTGIPGLSLFALKCRTGMCPLVDADLIKLQGNLFALWIDKIKMAQDQAVTDRFLRSLPAKLWSPELARRELR